MGPTDTSWFTAGNWNPANVPTAGQDAIVNNGTTAQVGPGVTRGAGNAVANNLTIGNLSTVEVLPTGTLTLGTSLTIDAGGTLLFSGGTVVGAGNVFTDNGTFSLMLMAPQPWFITWSAPAV